MHKELKVHIALSGGVDSAAAAALLKKQGHSCTGVYLNLMDNQTSRRDCLAAENVCKHLHIPFKTYNFQNTFEQIIIKPFIEKYRQGKTPNPCILCNEKIKLGLFLQKSLKNGADMIATGHFAGIAQKSSSKVYRLLKAHDKQKDQSYFLYRLTQKQLSKTTFPLWKYTKEEVRKLADKFELPIQKKRESQDICFLNKQKLSDFLRHTIKPAKGKIMTTKGKLLGYHEGYWNFTIGQRKGMGISSQQPYYVVRLDPRMNQVIVSQESDKPSLFSNKIKIESLHWINAPANLPLKCQVSIRYNHNPVQAILDNMKDTYIIRFLKPQRAQTPGQSAVIYDKDECLGGGIIN